MSNLIDKTNSPEEIVDIVDRNDKIVGEILKIKANKNPNVIHREVAILVFNDERKVLWQQRSLKKIVEPGAWTISVAGHISKGMEPDETAHLELREELGFNSKVVFVDKIFLERENETNFFYLYICKHNNETINFETAEIEKVEFMNESDITELRNKSEQISEFSLEFAKRFWSGEFDQEIANKLS